MRAFIDTSSLVKKYINESGAGELDTLLEGVSEIIVAPVYWLELNSAIERRRRAKTLNVQQAFWIKSEAKKDYIFFNKIIWNENFEAKGLEFIEKYHLKTLDSIQLASGCLSQADIFITSDKELFATAKKELKNVKFI